MATMSSTSYFLSFVCTKIYLSMVLIPFKKSSSCNTLSLSVTSSGKVNLIAS
jgi:hypothetical protein